MSIALAQPVVNGTTLSSPTMAGTFGSNTTTGNTLVVCAMGYDNVTARTVSSIAISTGSASFTKQIAQPGVGSSYDCCEWWAAANITGGTTPKITVTFSGTIDSGAIFLYELSGMPTSLTLDGTPAGVAGTTNTTMSAPSITTTGTNDIIFAGFAVSQFPSAGESGWTATIDSGNNGLTEYNIVTAAQTGLVVTATQTPTGTYAATVFALQGASSGVSLAATVQGKAAISGHLSPQGLTGSVQGKAANSGVIKIARGFSGTVQGKAALSANFVLPTPVIIQHVSTAANNNVEYAAGTPTAGNPFYINLPNPTGAGNCLIISISSPYSSGRTTTITDNKGTNTWTRAATVNNGTMMSSTYVALNVAAGTQNITVTFDTTLFACQFCLTEAYNVAATGAIDATGTATTNATNGNLATSSMTTAAGGDLIYQYGYDLDNTLLTASGISGFTAGSGFTLLSADVMVGSFCQYKIQSGAGAITPSCTVSGVLNHFNTIAIALKAATQGTPPPGGIRIVGVHHIDQWRAGSIQIPSFGNLLYISAAIGTSNVLVTSVTSSPSNTWTQLTPITGDGNGPPQCFYAANATTSPNLTVTVTGTTSLSTQATYIIYDVVNAHSSPFDSSNATTPNGAGNDYTVNAGNFTLGSITPTTTHGLVFATMGTYLGEITAATGAGQILDSVTYGNEVDADLLDNADGYAHYYNTTTSTVNFGWTMAGASLSGETIRVVAFKAAPGFVVSGSVRGLGVLSGTLTIGRSGISGNLIGKAAISGGITRAMSLAATVTGKAALSGSVTFPLGNLWVSNGADTGGSGTYVAGTQSVQYIHDHFANNGDTITIPAGSFTWTNGVVITKGLTITGAGTQNMGSTTRVAGTLNTTLNVGAIVAISFTTAASYATRISTLYFPDSSSGGPANGVIAANSAKGNLTWRIDNCRFSTGHGQTTTAGNGPDGIKATFIQISGTGAGLIDHCELTGGQASEMIHNLGNGAGITTGWQDDIVPGSANMVFLENCTFSKYYLPDQYFWGCSAIQSYYGARNVIRYCTFNYCQIDQHGNTNVGTRWFELYNNTFYTPSGGNQSNAFALRAGSGFVYNNVASGGPNAGTGAIELYSDFTNNPPSYGPGAGIVTGSITASNSNSPVYLWNNDSHLPIGSGSSNVVAGTEYITESGTGIPTNMTIYQAAAGAQTNYAYTPYVYPHPLDSGTPQNNTSGVVTGKAVISGVVKVVRALAGTVRGVGRVSSQYTIHGNQFFTGTVTGAARISGQYSIAGHITVFLAGTVTGTSIMVSLLTTLANLAGVCTGVSTCTGTLLAYPPTNLLAPGLKVTVLPPTPVLVTVTSQSVFLVSTW